MPVPNEEVQRYNAFVVQLSRRLESVNIPLDTILWHYTTGAALTSIIETQSIFSTQVSCLNDATEIRYSSGLFRTALENLRPNLAGLETNFLEKALSYFKEDTEYPAQSGLPYFVTCFSETADDLSQWRAYGSGENGYSIGFKAENLRAVPTSVLVRVNYDSDLHKTLAAEVAEATIIFFRDGFRNFGQDDLDRWTGDFLTAWDLAITQAAPFVKDPGFKSERECRIVKPFRAEDLGNLRFVQKNTLMSRHLPLQPGRINSIQPYRLPIAQIMVGPGRHRHVSRISVDTLLRQRGYPTGMVTTSRIPFQIT